jgi:HSP20 family protein
MSGISGSPRTNIRETDEEFTVEMAAPGRKRDDFHVELDNDMLKIWTEKEQTNEDNNESYTRREFSYESFSRSFYLPNTVEADKIKAKYEDGMLRLMIPKKEEAKRKPPRTIKIS